MKRFALYLLPVAILAIVVLMFRLSAVCSVRESFKEAPKGKKKATKPPAGDDRPQFHDVLYGYKVAFPDGGGPYGFQSMPAPLPLPVPVAAAPVAGVGAVASGAAPVASVPVAPAPAAPKAGPVPNAPKDPKPQAVTTKRPSTSTTFPPKKVKVEGSSKKCNDWIMSVKRGSPDDKMLNKDRSTTNFLVHNTKLNQSGGDGESVWKWMAREIPACKGLEWDKEFQETYDQHMKSVGMMPKKPSADQKKACMAYISGKYAKTGRDTTDHKFKLDYKWPKTGYTEWDYITSTVPECKDLVYEADYQAALDKARARAPTTTRGPSTTTTRAPTTPVPAAKIQEPEVVCNPDFCLPFVRTVMDGGTELDTGGGVAYSRCAGCPYVKASKNGRNWDARIAMQEVASNKTLAEAKDIIQVKFCESLKNTTATNCKNLPKLVEEVRTTTPGPTTTLKPKCPDCATVITDWMKSAMASARQTLATNPPHFTDGYFEFDWQSVPPGCCTEFVRQNTLTYRCIFFKVKDMPGYEWSAEKVRSFLKFYAESNSAGMFMVGMWIVKFGASQGPTHPFYSSATYMQDMPKTYKNVLDAMKLTGKVYESNALTTFYTDDKQPHEWGGFESGAGDLKPWKEVKVVGGTTNGVPVGIFRTADDNAYSEISLITVPKSHVVLCLHPDPENTPNVRMYANAQDNELEAHHLSQYGRNKFWVFGWVCFGDPNTVFNDNVAYAIVFPHEEPAILREDPDHDEAFVVTKNICGGGCDCDQLSQAVSTGGRVFGQGVNAVRSSAPGIVQQAGSIGQQGVQGAAGVAQPGIDLVPQGASAAGGLAQQAGGEIANAAGVASAAGGVASAAGGVASAAGGVAQQGIDLVPQGASAAGGFAQNATSLAKVV